MFIVHVHCSLFMFIVHCSHGATLIFDDVFSIVVLGSVPNFLAILERETPSRRRRRAAQAEEIDEHDDLICDMDD